MAIRNDITIRWDLSPRLIIIDASSNEIVMQDLIDTLRTLEALPSGIDEPFIMNASGKEDLGGGTSVGLTVELQNAQIYFEERSWQELTGTVTTANAQGTILIDATADFTAGDLDIGHIVFNGNTAGMATIVNIDSSTQLKTLSLSGSPVRNDWQIGDGYIIYHNELCATSGGNLVAIDINGGSLYPILQSPNVQSTLTSSSSATLQSQAATEYASFGDAVTVDANSSYVGTTFPIGTGLQPVNNIPDARVIAIDRGFSTFIIRNNYTFGSGDNIEDFSIIGTNPGQSTFMFESAALTANTEISQATISGEFDGPATFISCHINDVSAFAGDIHDSVLFGTIQLTGFGQSLFINCTDGKIVSPNPPAIDFGGTGSSVAVRNYHGDLQLSNKTGSENVEINVNSGGHITINSDVTDGIINLTGIMQVSNFATGDASVDISQVIFPDQIQLSAFDGHVFIDPLAGTIGTEFPLGTHPYPVNNLDDAQSIMNIRGLKSIQLSGTLVINPSDNIDNLKIIGSNPLTTIVVLSSGCSTFKTDFRDMILLGEVNGPIYAEGVGLQNLTNLGSNIFPTVFRDCIFRPGSFIFQNGLTTAQNVHFIDCVSGIPGAGTIAIDANGTTTPIAFRRYTGGLNFRNFTGGNSMSVDMNSGQIKLESTVIDASIQLRGVAELTQNDASTSANIYILFTNKSDYAATTVNKVIPIIYGK